jgi:pyruvate/2-oxoglutarate dehydrogenase complex dihydrolipoamide dehydrogenase (E3) component
MTNSGGARGWARQPSASFIKVIVDTETDEIPGATAVCEHGSEIIESLVGLVDAVPQRER